MQSASYTDYVKALQGFNKGTVTLNWDVAVTYEASKINELLEHEHQKPGSGMPSKVLLHFDEEDFDGNLFTQHYELVLGSPLIQFCADSSNPTCSLEMPVLSGRIWRSREDGTKGRVTELGGQTYSIKLLNLSLAAVTASSTSPVLKSGSNLITFPADTTAEHIVVDFVTNGPKVAIEIVYHKGEARSMPIPMKRAQLLTACREYFQLNASAIDYTLAVVNNAKPQDNGLDLVPRRFCFVCTGSKDRSYLTLLIQTTDSISDPSVQGMQSMWDGQWAGDMKIDPVPAGETAAIIINKSFLINQYLKKTLKSGKTSVDYTAAETKTPKDGKPGFLVEFTWKEISIKGAGDTKDYTGELYDLNVYDRIVNPNVGGEKLNMMFGQSNGPDKLATIQIKWSYKDHIKWKYEWSSGSDGVHGGGSKTGTLIGTYSLDKTYDFQGALDQKSFNVKVNMASKDWTFSQAAESTAWGEKFKAFIPGLSHKSEYIPPFVSAMAGTFIEFEFDFGALKFFSVTNVLLPGKKVIDIDLNAGVRIPNDLVMVGNVVKDAVVL